MSILRLLAADGFLSVNKHIARIVGLDAAVILAELASAHNYFESEGSLTDDGMFFETVERIEENTTLTRYQQAKAIKVLETAGILETVKKGIPAKRYFRINEEKVIALLDHKRSKNLTTGGEKTSPLEVKKLERNNNRVNKNTENKRFILPTVDEVRAYCIERGNNVDPERFVDYYTSKGWMIGKNKMKDWKAAVRTWERGSTGGRKKKQDLDDFYGMMQEWVNEG